MKFYNLGTKIPWNQFCQSIKFFCVTLFVTLFGILLYYTEIRYKKRNNFENEKRKLQRMIRKFPSIQQNRQHVILFHETIPLTLIQTFPRPVNMSAMLASDSLFWGHIRPRNILNQTRIWYEEFCHILGLYAVKHFLGLPINTAR
jgi:hypothetical protein